MSLSLICRAAVVYVHRVVRAARTDVRVRHRRQLLVRRDTPTRPIAQNLRHQVPPHRARRRRSCVPPAGRRRHHAAGLLRIWEAASNLQHGHATSHTVSVYSIQYSLVSAALCYT